MRRQQAVGEAFEDAVVLHARALGIYVRRNYVGVRFIGGRPVVVAKGLPDFWLVAEDGTAVLFDAKSTENRDVFYPPRSRAHQLEEMRELVSRVPGARAGYLVEWREDGEVEWFPVSERTGWPVRMERGKGEIRGNLMEVLKKLAKKP